MDEHHLFSHLASIGQEHLLSDLACLPNFLQRKFAAQVAEIPGNFYAWQQKILKTPGKPSLKLSSPKVFTQEPGMQKPIKKNIGVVILAGGQGSRLGHLGPKGTFVLPTSGKSLFEILLGKCKAESEKSQYTLFVAVMTSQNNHAQTKSYLQKHHYFGLEEKQVDIFPQKAFPLLNENHQWFLESPGRLATGPGGNGQAMACGRKIWQKWQAKGVEYIQVIPIDNPLAKPVDRELIHLQIHLDCDLALLTAPKDSQDEQIGSLGAFKDTLYVREYGQENHDFLPYGYLGIFACRLALFLQVMDMPMPWHVAEKEAGECIKKGFGWQQRIIRAKKFETFIFDFFPQANNFCILEKSREEVFQPLKSRTGKFGITALDQKISS